MISTARVWRRVGELAKSGTSGYDDQGSFNDKIASVQTEMQELLYPLYEKNQAATDAMAPFVMRSLETSDNAGEVSKQDDYAHALSVLLIKGDSQYPTHKIGVNGRGMIITSPVRQPSYEDNEIVYYFANDTICVEPKMIMDLEVCYLRKPDEAKIALLEVSSDDSDYLTVDDLNTIDLEWPESVFNLLVYLLLEKLGVEMKEEILFEYSNFGITRDMIKTDPN